MDSSSCLNGTMPSCYDRLDSWNLSRLHPSCDSDGDDGDWPRDRQRQPIAHESGLNSYPTKATRPDLCYCSNCCCVSQR